MYHVPLFARSRETGVSESGGDGQQMIDEKIAKGCVFLVWHVHTINGVDDEKLIGAYSTETEAQAAIIRLGDKPGFVDCNDGFLIDSYEINQDRWTGGYATV